MEEQRLLQDLVNKALEKELQLNPRELAGYDLDAKIELLSAETVERIMAVLFASNAAVSVTSNVPKNVWIVIAAKLFNRDIARFVQINKFFYQLFKDLSFVNQVLLRRHGEAFDQQAFEKRMSPEMAPNPLLRLRAFEIVMEFWDPQRTIVHPTTKLRVRPAQTEMSLNLVNPSQKTVIMFMPNNTLSMEESEFGSVSYNLYLHNTTESNVISRKTIQTVNFILKNFASYGGDEVVEYHARDIIFTRARLENTIYQLMAHGYNVIKQFRIEYYARPSDQIPVDRTPDDFMFMFNRLCFNCNEIDPRFECGHGCNVAFYCNQQCADTNYQLHDCPKK